MSRLVRAVCPVAVLSLALLFGGCSLLEDDPKSNSKQAASPGPDSDSTESDSETVCGMEVLPSPTELTASACESGTSRVSETFTRTSGSPNTTTRQFTVDASSQLCLTIQNGAASSSGAGKRGKQGTDGLTAAWIYVDDELVLAPEDFEGETNQLRETLKLPEGSHQIGVRLASEPGSSLHVEARTAERTPDQEPAVSNKGHLKVDNVAVDHPLFSPNGDGYHDTAQFNADNIPTNLPGKQSGQFSYEIDWKWTLTDADSCSTVSAGLSGTTPVNSPTNVQATWDGTDSSGSVATDGNYIYQYHAKLVRSDGLVVDSVTATARGLVLDTTIPDYSVQSFGDSCDPSSDPYNCKCPNQTPDGTRCTFAWIPYLTTFESPEMDTSSFLSTHQDSNTGRWEVVVDLRSFNGGGLIPQTSGTWKDIDQLQYYISELTGVPQDPDDTRLFNFDYIQLGYSTPVVKQKGVVDGFNHFLLDVITDSSGSITIDGRTIDLKAALRSSDGPIPEAFEIDDKRLGDECGTNGNTDGVDDIRAKSCTNLRTANLDPNGTDLGIYVFNKRIFGAEINGEGTVRDENCIVNGIYKCGVRTFFRDVDSTLTSRQYIERDDIQAVRENETNASSLPSIVSHTDRVFTGPGGETSIIDGFCSEDTASRGSLTAPLDSGAGALPGTCIVNGIY